MAEWYSSRNGLRTIQQFHEDFAIHPKAMSDARLRHHEIMTELLDYLKYDRNVVKRPEYTGSGYEGLRVDVDGQLEFDVMLILNGGEMLEAPEAGSFFNFSNYSQLVPKNNAAKEKLKKFIVDGKICPNKVRHWFHGELNMWLNKHKQRYPGEVTLHYNGPATMATVYHTIDGKQEEWYDVDLVPAFEVVHSGERKIFVAKPRDMDEFLWRKSYSLEEKEQLRNIDASDNGCRKKIIRILKVIRERETNMKKMVSYYIKCKIMEMTETRPWLSWSEENLAVRLRDVMLELANSMADGYQKHPFDDSVNILADLSKIVRSNIAGRLKHIANSEVEATKVFMGKKQGLSLFDPEDSFSSYRSPVQQDSDSDDEPYGNSVRPYSGGSSGLAQREEPNAAAIGLGGLAAAAGIGLLAFGAYKYYQANKKD